MQSTLRLLMTAALPFVLSMPSVAQAVPTAINYQGRLTDNGTPPLPVTATVAMQFEIWDGIGVTASRLWREPDADGGSISVQVNGGVFSVMLGANGNPLPAPVFAGGATRYLQVIIDPAGSAQALSPRQAIGTAPFAARAEGAADSANLGGVAASGYQRTLNPNTCPAGQVFVQIRDDGSAQCAPDLTGVTAVTATGGLSGSVVGSTLNLSTDITVQRRNVAPSCPAGQYVQAIAANGTPTCTADAGLSAPLALSGNLATPIFSAVNNGAGEGVSAQSVSGTAIRGTTNDVVGGYAAVSGSNPALGSSGVLGGSALLGPTPTPIGAYGGASTGWGVYASTSSGRAVNAAAAGASGANYGVYASTASSAGYAVHGVNNGNGNFGRLGSTGEGVYGGTTGSAGVRGEATTGAGIGVAGYSNSNSGTGVSGATLGGGTGVLGSASGGYGVKGTATTGEGVHGEAGAGIGVMGVSTSGFAVRGDTGSGTAILGYSNSNTGVGVAGTTLGGGTGVRGTASSGLGVYGSTAGTGLATAGVYGEATAGSGYTYAVQGVAASTTGRGVYGHATATTGYTDGVIGEVESIDGVGVRAIGASTDDGYALSVENGRVRAVGAGVNTHTFAFIHSTIDANTNGHFTCINNAMLNGHPEAIVVATPVRTSGGLAFNFPISIFYATSTWYPNSSWMWDKWCIFREDLAPDGMPTGHRFHVLAFFP